MKKYFIAVYLSLFAYVLLVPFHTPWTEGMYNKVTNRFVCTTESWCIHEIAHQLDDEAGWMSHTFEYYETISSFHPNVEKGFLNKNMEEIYAIMFQMSEGNPDKMPEPFRRFYDWERADELLEIYVRSK